MMRIFENTCQFCEEPTTKFSVQRRQVLTPQNETILICQEAARIPGLLLFNVSIMP